MKAQIGQQTQIRSEPEASGGKHQPSASGMTPQPAAVPLNSPETATVGTRAAKAPEPAPKMRPGNNGGSIVAGGRWTKGVSGNPTGRPQSELAEEQEKSQQPAAVVEESAQIIAREHGELAALMKVESNTTLQ